MRHGLSLTIPILVLALGGCSGDASSTMGSQTSYIVGATVLVGEGLEPLENAVLAIDENGTIAEVGTRSEVEVPAGAAVTDASSTTLVPGFIDAHVHIGFYEPKKVLAGGVTTARDLAWPPEIIFPLARRSAEPGFEGPQIFGAGPMLTALGGYPTQAAWAPDGTGLIISSPSDAADAVAHLAAEKASIVKVALNPDGGPVLDLTTLAAIVKEAHAAGLKVTGHVTGLAELEKAIEAGIDELAHMLMGSNEIPDDLIEKMVARNMVVVPTLAVRSGRERRVAVDNLRRFLEKGGTAIYGTDLGNAGVSPGIDRGEIKLMGKAGMSPIEILRSATVEAAAWLDLPDRGTIEVGKRADLVALAGTGSPSDLSKVKMVFRQGSLVR